jgi:hypothetical protein
MTDAPSDNDPRLAGLYRIMSAVVHDLSNPLQALVMNAELAAEDAARDDEEAERRAGDLAATRRMQGILRALTSLCASAAHPRPLGDAIGRFQSLLARRWSRLLIGVRPEIHDRRNLVVPAALEEALLLCGIELSGWLRMQPPRAAQLVVTAHDADGHLRLTFRLDDATRGAAMVAATREAVTAIASLAVPVTVDVSDSQIELGCELLDDT